ncbi:MULTISPECIES: carbohydrate ABC transporter permease [Catenuloplanes]|uniref:Multiple sugar transport system permease protein n=1 Tax=Catenuloplanes niger TaxID=587534 RepID=A0AAE4CT95_9ACTN|nr:sugar ABC transporter permease [Catenuloplanes niger]MDR7325061.1 multiple sugar transport system permease protein [Catenuloplanes niger]
MTTIPARVRYGDATAGLLFLTPWLLGMLLLTIGPMLASLYLSFTDYDLFDTPEWVGLDNYRRMFDDPRYLQSVTVTTAYVALAVPLKLAAALGVALLLNRPRLGQGLYRSAFYAPSLIGASVSLSLVWKSIFSDDAVVDRGLAAIGLDTGGWVGRPEFSLPMLVLLAAWQFGGPMVIFLAGLKQIPGELYEAAAVDGAGPWRRFRAVTLPMLSPVLFFNLLLEIIGAFQVFTSAFVIATGAAGGGGPAGSTLLYTVYLYGRGFVDFRMGYASAMAWMLVLGVGLVTALLFRTSRMWVHYAGDRA